MKENIILVDSELKKIQQIRLLHAISEVGYTISIPRSESKKIKPLVVKFKLKTIKELGENGLKLSQISMINHHLPETSIGIIKRPLIFPLAIVDYCKTLWVSQRKHKFSFIGLITKDRENSIKHWVRQNITKKEIRFPDYNSKKFKLKNKIFKLLKISNIVQLKFDSLTIWSSFTGRNFPEKSWDENYYQTLANSEFVLCPNGDYIWSYRFFEAVLCGAIPIIEEYCEAYQGFRFKLMSENASTFIWSKDDAEFNYRLCCNLITIPSPLIISEIKSKMLPN